MSPAGAHRIRFSAVAVGCTAFPGKCAPAALLESPRGQAVRAGAAGTKALDGMDFRADQEQYADLATRTDAINRIGELECQLSEYGH